MSFIFSVLLMSLGISQICTRQCMDGVMETIQNSEEDFNDLSTDIKCPPHFEVCSQPDVQTISVGDQVSSLCRLHTTSMHADNLIMSYHTDGEIGSCTTVEPNDICRQIQPGTFDLVIIRPNDNNKDREAKIFIFDVTRETRLNVLCTARQQDGIRRIDVANNTLMIEFILSNSGTVTGLGVGFAASLLAAIILLGIVIAQCVKICKLNKNILEIETELKTLKAKN